VLPDLTEGDYVSIVRVGLAETKNFGEGYDAIFGKKKSAPAKAAKPAKKSAGAKTAKAAGAKKKKPAKKK
jgi:hypothetical protein